ncbi:unnamed protein product [Protopolystoma xenopodis]|uniref:Uncharacterized protein n=1 Tax=Protopolystoma xenopodis TaxID=117903 RepID=A0A448X551_9PLAT|nr:unnamed protein product [Protopolystoma xenopodis]
MADHDASVLVGPTDFEMMVLRGSKKRNAETRSSVFLLFLKELSLETIYEQLVGARACYRSAAHDDVPLFFSQ